MRSVGKLPAVLTFAGDFLKCVAALLLSQAFVALIAQCRSVEFYDVARYVAGMACVLGHIFPVSYGFRGGKGVVTSAAMIALTDWRVFLLVLLAFAIVFAWKRIVSLASMLCAALYPVFTFLFLFLAEFSGSPLPSHGEHSLSYVRHSLPRWLTVVLNQGNITACWRSSPSPWERRFLRWIAPFGPRQGHLITRWRSSAGIFGKKEARLARRPAGSVQFQRWELALSARVKAAWLVGGTRGERRPFQSCACTGRFFRHLQREGRVFPVFLGTCSF